MTILGEKVEVLYKLLDLTSQKSKIHANNIANANTPGYKKLEVRFDDELKKALKSKDVEKIKNVTAKIALSDNETIRANGNNVDIDMELVEFYTNADKHNLYLEILSKKFKGTISAIQGR